MNICIDGRVLQESQYSGVSNYTHQLLDALFKIDRKNKYFVICTGLQSFSPDWAYPNVTVVNIRIPNKIINLLFLLRLVNVSQLCRFVKIPVPDCVWIPNHNFWMRNGHVPLVLTLHDLSSHIFPELFSYKQRLWHRLIRTHYLAKVSDSVVCVSRNTMHDALRIFDIESERLHVVYPGVAVSAPSNDSPHDKAYVLFVGNIEPRKNLDTAISAFLRYREKHSSPLDFVVLGAVRRKKVLARYRFHSGIHFVGYVDDRVKASWYAHASALVYPSIYEGFGFPPLEAARYNIPVITSHVASLSEVGDKNFILVDPYNVTDLVQAYGLALDTGSKQDMAIAYSWDDSASNMLSILQKYANRN